MFLLGPHISLYLEVQLADQRAGLSAQEIFVKTRNHFRPNA